MQINKQIKKISSLIKVYDVQYKQYLAQKANLSKLINDLEEQILELENSCFSERKKYSDNTNMLNALNNYEIYVLSKKKEIYNSILDLNLEISNIDSQALNAYHKKSACQNFLDKLIQKQLKFNNSLEIKEIEEWIQLFKCNLIV